MESVLSIGMPSQLQLLLIAALIASTIALTFVWVLSKCGSYWLQAYMSGADVRMDGRALIVRGYRGAWTWPIKPGESMATTLARTPCTTPTFREEKQGEAIGFLANDGSYTSTGEMSGAPVRQYRR